MFPHVMCNKEWFSQKPFINGQEVKYQAVTFDLAPKKAVCECCSAKKVDDALTRMLPLGPGLYTFCFRVSFVSFPPPSQFFGVLGLGFFWGGVVCFFLV